jgi:predicted kinase
VRPLLVALRGMPGIGKSALAHALGPELGWAVFDKDDFKAVVYGRTDEPDTLAYDLLYRVLQRQLEQGLNCICDSPMMYPGLFALASRTAQDAGAQLVVLDCVLNDASEHRRRIESRVDWPAWGIRNWSDLVDYRARNLANLGYAIEAPCRAIDLSQPPTQAAREAADWLRTLSAGIPPRRARRARPTTARARRAENY